MHHFSKLLHKQWLGNDNFLKKKPIGIVHYACCKFKYKDGEAVTFKLGQQHKQEQHQFISHFTLTASKQIIETIKDIKSKVILEVS